MHSYQVNLKVLFAVLFNGIHGHFQVVFDHRNCSKRTIKQFDKNNKNAQIKDKLMKLNCNAGLKINTCYVTSLCLGLNELHSMLMCIDMASSLSSS